MDVPLRILLVKRSHTVILNFFRNKLENLELFMVN